MKNRVFILSFLISMISVNFVFAQPIAKKLSYQAVVRNAANELVVNQNLSVEITILNAENAPQYRETHPSVPTNQNGLLSLWVGEGTPTLGTMANVVWKDATIRSVFTLPDGSTVTQNTPVTAMPYAYFADEVDTVFLQNYLDTHDVVPDNYVTHPQLNDTMKNYLTINGLCDSIKNCEAITNLQGLIESCTTNITNNTTNITNNTTNISNITNNITQLQAADSVLSTRFAKDSIALSKRMDTMFTHMCDSIEQCEVITKLQNTDSLLGARITTDSIWSHRADSVLSTRIINDSVIFYKTDSVLLAHILNDSVLSHQVDSVLLARILSDSTNLANNYYTKDKINDTLSHYTTTDDINGLLGDYEKKSDLCNDVMNCAGIQTMQTNITNVANNLDSTKVNIRNEINSKVANLQKADSVLGARITADSIISYKADSVLAVRITTDSIWSHRADSVLLTRIINDSVIFYKTDSVLLAHILNDSVLSHQVDSVLLARILIDSTNLANNYYNKDKINDTLSHYSTTDDVNNLLGNYATKDTLKNYLTIDGLCDSIKKCDIISNLQNNVTNNTTNITNNMTNITNNTTNITNLMNADSALEARLIDTVSKLRLALKDSLNRYLDSAQVRKEIHDSIGNGTLTITYGDNTPVTFTANQKTPSSIDIPAVPTSVAQLTDANDYAKVNGNTFTGTHDFTTSGTIITVPSNGTDIPRPADSDPTSCNNNNAVAVCDLLAVFDSLSNRIKKLEDELAAMNQPTSAVSVSLSEITRTSLKATATMNDPNLNVTSYEICISESASMSDSSCQTISTTNEYTFTGLKPNTVYYVTAKAYHNSGTATSDVASGKTLPLTLDISISPASPVCLCDSNPTTVTYTANIEDANMDDYSFLWSVPDGNPLPDNPDERICTITYSVSASYKVTCTATLQANPTVQLTADTTITVQICTTPTITTCETDSTVTVMSVTGNPDFIDWNDGHIGNSVSENSTHTYNNPGTYEIEVSLDGCSYKHKVALGDAALYPCTVSAAHTNTTEYTGSSTSPGTGGLETTDSEGKVTHVADQDGNIYPVVQIGSQCWMAKNLRTTHFSDGTEMTLTQMVENNTYDDINDIPYRYKPALGMDYLSSWGYYYNWKAAKYGNTTQGVCPKGWHLPSKEEWETMATVVNGSEIVFPYSNYAVHLGTLAGKLSSGCNWHPLLSEPGSYPENYGQEGAPGDYDNPERNASGFSSIPAGWVSASTPGWVTDNTYAYYWSSTLKPNDSDYAYALFWNHNYNVISCVPMKTKQSASSVRCLRDETALTSYPTLSVTPSTTSLSLCPGTSESVSYTAKVIVNGGVATNDYSYTWKVTNTTTNTTETLSDHTSQVTIPYSEDANYKVSCVANSNTTTDSATNAVMTLVRVKVGPSFIPSVSGYTVTLTALQYVYKVKWTSDGQVVDLPNNASHTYSAPGTYQITAFTAANCAFTDTVEVEVVSLNIEKDNATTSICSGGSTTITYTANLTNATANSYSWSVTGEPTDGFDAPSGITTDSYTVTFTKAGNYTVSCTAATTSSGDVPRSVQTAITELNTPNFTSTTVNGATVTLNELTHTNKIIWDNNNASTTTDTLDGYPASAEHIYNGEPGLHAYTIIATDTTTGCSKTDHVDVTIPAPAPSLSIEKDDATTSICSGGSTTITYTANLTNATASSYSWSVTPTTGVSPSSGSGTSATFEVAYSATGSYTFSCTATTSSGDVQSSLETVINPLATPEFTISGASTGTVTVAETVSGTEIGITQVNWGDDVTNNQITHSYNASNSYNITVYYTNGCSKTVPNVAVEVSGGGGNNIVDLKHSCIVSGSLPSGTLPSPTPWSNTNNKEKGRKFGDQVTVLDSVSDYEGNWYKVVQIGTQCWLRENMRATQYSDNQHASVNYYYYPNGDNSNSNVKTYGLLYDYTTATHSASYTDNATAQGICPSGWHVPKDSEWRDMITSVNNNVTPTQSNGRYNVDVRLFVDGNWNNNSTTCSTTDHYPCDDNPAFRNKSGFSALPAGFKYNNSYYFGSYAEYWSFWASNTNRHTCSMIYNKLGVGVSNFSSSNAASVRCVRD